MNYGTMLMRFLTLIARHTTAFVALFCLALSGLTFAAPADDVKEASRLYQQGRLDQALAKVNAALAVQPKDAQGRFIKGLILTEQKKPADAIQVFTGLTEDFPELPEPYNNLAVLFAGQGNYDKAKAALELAIHTHPAYATAHENLGDIYAQLARRAYDKALQLDKSNATAQSKLAMVKEIFSTPKPRLEPTKTAAVAAPVDGKPGTKPATTPTITPPVAGGAGTTDAARATIMAWAKAWAAKDVAGYLAFYAPDFEPSPKLGRAAWEAQRRERIERPKQISVEVAIRTLTVKGSEATVVFRQTYASDTTTSKNTKTIKLTLVGGKWLIKSEKAA
jgi:tetratricopeptide (TPR) repeat protein